MGRHQYDELAGGTRHRNHQGEPMSEFKQKEERELSRQQAAERLTDIAYALTAGDRLRLHNEEEVDFPSNDRVTLRCESRSRNRRVELAIELSWSES
jgi:amphi-Trp domain-containing protein